MSKFWTFLSFFVALLCVINGVETWITGENQPLVRQISNEFILALLFLGHGLDRVLKGKVIHIGNNK